MPRGPMVHTDDLEASDNYADPVDTLQRSRGFHNDDIYAVPDDTHSRLVKIRNSFGVLHGLQVGEEENGFDRKCQAGRRPSKYKHRSKILFSKTKAYQRRFHSDSDGEESGPATQKKKKGRAHRGSEEDPLLSPADPWKGGIDNPAITSDPEQEDKKMKKKKTPKTPKESKKVGLVCHESDFCRVLMACQLYQLCLKVLYSATKDRKKQDGKDIVVLKTERTSVHVNKSRRDCV